MIASQGDSFPVIGQSEDGIYLLIHMLDYGIRCWGPRDQFELIGPVESLAFVTPMPPDTTDGQVVVWEGTWTTRLGDPTGDVEDAVYEIDLNQEYDVVSGSFYDEPSASMIEIEGSVNYESKTLVGSYYVGIDRGPFYWQMINDDQFVGSNNDGEFYWCGYRNDAGFPEPCMGQ